MYTDTYIPRRLDDQWKIAFWDADVAMPVLFSLFLAFLSHSKLSAVVIVGGGVFVSRWLGRVKSDKHPYYALHWLYWNFPTSPFSSMKATPPSHVRRMVG